MLFNTLNWFRFVSAFNTLSVLSTYQIICWTHTLLINNHVHLLPLCHTALYCSVSTFCSNICSLLKVTTSAVCPLWCQKYSWPSCGDLHCMCGLNGINTFITSNLNAQCYFFNFWLHFLYMLYTTFLCFSMSLSILPFLFSFYRSWLIFP